MPLHLRFYELGVFGDIPQICDTISSGSEIQKLKLLLNLMGVFKL